MFDYLPQPTEKRIAIHVKPAAERALRAGHPWLFDESIRKQSRDGQAGDLAVIYDQKKRFLAIGLYDPASPIRVKLLQHRDPAIIDAAWFAARLQAAAKIRASLPGQGTTGYRLLHGENDGLPGLIVDRYADTLVIKLYTAAWLPHLRHILSALDVLLPGSRWVLRLSRSVPEQYGLHDGLILRGDALDGPIRFTENGLSFFADVLHGHKTGFFFDQRENRARVGQLAQNRRVLDVFAYTGGFSAYAAHGGAASVLSTDLSEPALAAAAHNVALNRQADVQHETLAGDAFDVLEGLRKQQRRFDLLVIDPPSFAKQASEVPRALAAYERLLEAALPLLVADGVLAMASCSSRVSADDFFAALHRAAQRNGRPLHETERTGHALDHPIGFAEGAYLKCLYANVP